MNKERLEHIWRPALIVLLVISAFFLARATGYYDGLAEYFRTENQLQNSMDALDGLSGVRTVHPLAIVVCEENGAKSVSAYDGERTEEAFGRFSAFLGEALGSAGEPQQIYELDFRSGMDAGCVVFTFHCPQNLGALSRWLGTEMNSSAASASADVLYLRLFEGETVFCYRDGSGVYFRCSTAAQSETLRSRLQGGVPGTGAEFAYRNKDLNAISPYTVVLAQMPGVYAIESGNAVDSLNSTDLMESLGMNSYVASTYRESDGTRVYIDAERTLRIGADGGVGFHGPEGENGLASDEDTMRNLAYALAENSIGAYAGAADIYYAGEAYVDGKYTVYFDYCVNEIPVLLGSGHAAEISLASGIVTDISARLLQFTVQESVETVLPMPQACAIANAKGGGIPRFVYAEQNGIFSGAWINK